MPSASSSSRRRSAVAAALATLAVLALTALLAVVLQHEIRAQLAGAGGAAGSSGVLQRVPDDVRAQIAEPLATAFGNTFWWAVGMSAVAIIPTAILALSQRRERRAQVLAEAQSPVA